MSEILSKYLVNNIFTVDSEYYVEFHAGGPFCCGLVHYDTYKLSHKDI
jgi:hypothetical protein